MQPSSARVGSTSAERISVTSLMRSGFAEKRATTRMPFVLMLDDCRHDLTDRALQFAVIGDRRADRYLGRGDRFDSLGDHLGGVDEETCGDAFFQAVPAEIAD